MSKTKKMVIFVALFSLSTGLLFGCKREIREADRSVVIPKAEPVSNQNESFPESEKKEEESPSPETPKAQLANPASQFCVEKGGKVEIKTDSTGGQVGFCKFTNGKECEEWSMFRGECRVDGQ